MKKKARLPLFRLCCVGRVAVFGTGPILAVPGSWLGLKILDLSDNSLEGEL